MKRRMSLMLVIALLCSLCVFATVGEAEAVDAGSRNGWAYAGQNSVTGYDPSGRIARGPWFMYNTVNVAELGDGKSISFQLQAGEYKNGTNIVGTYTVSKLSDGYFTISYESEQQYGATKTILEDAYIWVNGTGRFRSSPGNQKGLAKAVKANEPFAFDGDTLYVFAHFVGTHYQWQGGLVSYTVKAVNLLTNEVIENNESVVEVIPGTHVSLTAPTFPGYLTVMKSAEMDIYGGEVITFQYLYVGGGIIA